MTRRQVLGLEEYLGITIGKGIEGDGLTTKNPKLVGEPNLFP